MAARWARGAFLLTMACVRAYCHVRRSRRTCRCRRPRPAAKADCRAAAAAVAATAAAAAPPRHPPQRIFPVLALAAARARRAEATAFDAKQRALLDKISGYLSSVQTLVGNFVQIGPDGRRVEGSFYIQKPGKVRFAL